MMGFLKTLRCTKDNKKTSNPVILSRRRRILMMGFLKILRCAQNDRETLVKILRCAQNDR